MQGHFYDDSTNSKISLQSCDGGYGEVDYFGWYFAEKCWYFFFAEDRVLDIGA